MVFLNGVNHPGYKHGHRVGKGSKEWWAWYRMRARCKYKVMERYSRYGGRGVKVSNRWLNSFENFLKDVGCAPSPKHSLDRIDNDGDYAPGNVKWSTNSEQIRNSSQARYLTYAGKTQTIGDWAKETGINRQTIQMRIDKYNWSISDALSIKP